jgi:hypothetical protein
MRRIVMLAALSATLVLAAAAAFAAEPVPADPCPVAKVAAGATSTAEPKITIEADDAKLDQLVAKVAEQSKKKIIAESTVKGNVPHFSVTGVTLEAALGAICKSGKCEWRRVFLPADSKLLEQPDKLASTLRLVTAMGFPEMVISGASNGKIAAHYVQDKSVKSVQDIAMKDPALTEVYVVTNDMAVAEKPKDDKNKALEDYIKQQKEMMDKFTKMTPEEQEQAMLEGINMFENMDPSYMASAMKAVSKMDPDQFARLANRSTEMMTAMSQEDRRAFLKMSMKMQPKMDPQYMKMMQEDMQAVMEELKAEGWTPPVPQQ